MVRQRQKIRACLTIIKIGIQSQRNRFAGGNKSEARCGSAARNEYSSSPHRPSRRYSRGTGYRARYIKQGAMPMSDSTVSLGPTSMFKPFDIRAYPSGMQPILAIPVSTPAGRVAAGQIEMVFGTPSRRYPTILLALFVLASLTTVISLIGLILGPFLITKSRNSALFSFGNRARLVGAGRPTRTDGQ